MKPRTIDALFLIAFLCGISRGLQGQAQARVILPELVINSDLIVRGVLIPGSSDTTDSIPYVSGAILTEKIIWGDELSFLTGEIYRDENIMVRWGGMTDMPPSPTPAFYAGKRGIWFLIRTDRAGIYLVDGTRYLPAKYEVRILRSLKKQAVFVRRTPVSLDKKTLIDLVVRNAHMSDMVVGEFRVEEGVLFIHPDISLAVTELPTTGRAKLKGGVRIHPREGRVAPLEEDEWVIVGSGAEYLVGLDLNELFQLNRDRNYTVQFKIKGLGGGDLLLDLHAH